MKKTLLSVVLAVASIVAFAQEPIKVLFVGNSYTAVNDLPGMVDSVSRSAGFLGSYQSNTPGGTTFSQHCTNESMSMIEQGCWDYVVLQEQSQLPSFPQSQVENQCFPYAARLVEAIRRYNEHAVPMFYMTWGRKDGDQQNARYYSVLGTYEGMDSMLYMRYMYMAEANEASVCPVGRVWRYIRTNYPDIELYQTDGSHPSFAGSYAAACSFFTLFFNQDPRQVTYKGSLDEHTAQLIREVVKDVVYDHYAYWMDPAHEEWGDTPEGIDDVDVDGIAIYPNPTTGKVNIDADFEICDMAGKVMVKGIGVADISNLSAGVYVVRIYNNGIFAGAKKLMKL